MEDRTPVGLRKNRYPHVIPALVSSGLLLDAIVWDGPYGYFTLLRRVVCASSAFMAYLAYERERTFWMVVLIGVAILFNPVAPVFLNREIWTVIDLLMVPVMVASVWLVRRDDSQLDYRK